MENLGIYAPCFLVENYGLKQFYLFLNELLTAFGVVPGENKLL